MMLGEQSFSQRPLQNPVILVAVVLEQDTATTILGDITWFGKRRYLWDEWLTTVDHKKIGVIYLMLAMTMLIRDFVEAMTMRTQQAIAVGHHSGFLTPEHNDQFFSEDSVIRIFFVAMPLIVGLMNIVIPLQIARPILLFPFLNAINFLLVVAGALLLNTSLGVGSFGKAG